MSQEVILRIVLENPTPGVEYGIQKGSGSNYETVQTQRSNSNDLCFEIRVQIKADENNNTVFFGPFTQGAPKERFIYIDIGTYAGQKDTAWSRRLKIPLKNIPKNILKRSGSEIILVAKMPGSGGNDGGPTCGTIKPFDGWKLVE